jgi:hypothetical protein
VLLVSRVVSKLVVVLGCSNDRTGLVPWILVRKWQQHSICCRNDGFATFFAAASIGQVHKATVRDDEDDKLHHVDVKVQYPRVAASIELDLQSGLHTCRGVGLLFGAWTSTILAASKQGEAALPAQLGDETARSTPQDNSERPPLRSNMMEPLAYHRQSNYCPFPIPRATRRILPKFIESCVSFELN